MTEIEIKGEKYCFLEVIPSLKKCWVSGNRFYLEFETYEASGKLPDGDWIPLFRYSTATGSDFEKVVGIEFDGDFQDFTSMNNNCITAKGSFQTLLRLHSIDPNADYIILKHTPLNK